MTRSHAPWVVVLAGGDGCRLAGAVVQGRRLDRPKQFCRIGGPRSLLQETLRRAERLTDRSRIVVLVRDEHRHWWMDELAHLPSQSVLAQPGNHGTAVAILHALVHVLGRDGDPTLVVLPSDHRADDETVLVEAIGHAVQVAAADRGAFVLLGLIPSYPETDYGWILPNRSDTRWVPTVSRFVEKPAARLADDLLAAGAFWNSFISASSGHALSGLFRASRHVSLRHYLDSSSLEMGDCERRAQFSALPCVDFGSDVLQPSTAPLRVLPVPPCGWTDLGTAQRVDWWLRGRGPQSLATLSTVAVPSASAPGDRPHGRLMVGRRSP